MTPDFHRFVDALAPHLEASVSQDVVQRKDPRAWRIRELITELRALTSRASEIDHSLETLLVEPPQLDEADKGQVKEEAHEIANTIATIWFASLSKELIKRGPRFHTAQPWIAGNSLYERFAKQSIRPGIADRIMQEAFCTVVAIGSALELLDRIKIHRIAENEFTIEQWVATGSEGCPPNLSFFHKRRLLGRHRS